VQVIDTIVHINGAGGSRTTLVFLCRRKF
jgi:hypothetical protein